MDSEEQACETSMLPTSLHSFRREPRTVRISRDRIVVPDVEMDSEFGRLYDSHLRGELLVGYTRLSATRIQTGFKRESAGGPTTLVETGKDEAFIRIVSAHLRAGSRPVVYLYRSSDGERKDYICSDDVNLMEAYRCAGIAAVPAAVLDPAVSSLEEGCLTFSCRQSPQGPFWVFVKAISPDYTTVPSILGGSYIAKEAVQSLEMLQAAIDHTLTQLRRFHCDRVESTHYHHTLASVLVRASLILRGVRSLCAEGLSDQVLALVRALYEMSLSLYLDWLSPEEFGQHFVWHAQLDKEGRIAVWDDIDRQRLKDGWSPDAVRALRKSWERIQEYIGSTGKRAALSRFKDFHSQFYRRLSSSAHQDFAVGVKYAGALSGNEDRFSPRRDNEEDIAFLLKCADLAVANICAIVTADIGPTAE